LTGCIIKIGDMMIEEILTESEKAICPHCEKELSKLFAKKITSTFGVKFVYFCFNCNKVLGISHRKGFWMG